MNSSRRRVLAVRKRRCSSCRISSRLGKDGRHGLLGAEWLEGDCGDAVDAAVCVEVLQVADERRVRGAGARKV